MKGKTLLILASFLICSDLGAAQPLQDMPHRVFGIVEDMQGSTITDSEVAIVYDGDTLASDT